MQQILSSKKYKARDPLDAIEMCMEKGWTDGLPVIPPTEAKVREFLDYVGRSPDEVLGKVPVRRRTVTVEKVVINAVMAGCRPEYLPVVLAAVEGMCDEAYNLHGSAASTGGSATLAIVNGPIVKQLGINAGPNLFGPCFRPNATIGRALRLFLINVCGTVPGTLDRSTMGHPGKYTYCIAEDTEAAAPWEPYHVEKGVAVDSSTVTVLPALGPHQARDGRSHDAEGVLTSIASVMATMGEYKVERNYGFKFCVVVIGEEHRNVLTHEAWTKKQVKDFLYQKSQRSVAELKRWGLLQGEVEPGDDEKIMSAVGAAEDIMVIAAGGKGANSACIAPWGGGVQASPVTRTITISR